MPLSFYLKTYPIDGNKDKRLVFSTRKSSLSVLSADVLDRAEKGALGPSEAETLKKLGVISEDREAERANLLSVVSRLNSNKKGITITVVLNLDCNFDCVYCYEGSKKGNRFMTEETADYLVSFAKSKFVPGMKHLTLVFYGGEPLLSKSIIRRIASGMKPFAEAQGAAYVSSMITNGSLFTRKAASELAELGLTSIRTTLDGPAHLHDGSRPFKGGNGSFSTIVENIKETLDLTRISIGGNFQRDNYKKFPELLDYLLSEGIGPDQITQVKFDPVMPREEGFGSAGDFVESCMSINEPWLIEASIFLREEILRRGFGTPKITPMPCMVELVDTFVVNYDGSLYKCPAFIGMEGFSTGDVRTGLRDYSETYRIGLWENDACRGCEYLPLCFGGCRYLSFMRTGAISPDCKKPYLDATLEAFLKQDVNLRKRPGAMPAN
jgi:uncharacterized protein